MHLMGRYDSEIDVDDDDEVADRWLPFQNPARGYTVPGRACRWHLGPLGVVHAAN